MLALMSLLGLAFIALMMLASAFGIVCGIWDIWRSKQHDKRMRRLIQSFKQDAQP